MVSKSPKEWQLTGDRCTSFFHKIANSKQARNSIKSLVIDDTVVHNESKINQHIEEYYKSLYTEKDYARPKLDRLNFNTIEKEQAE